jgi:hypothetical protein
VEGKFEGAWLELLFKVDNNHSALVVAVFFEVCHSIDPLCDAEFYQKSVYFGSFSTTSTPASAAPKPERFCVNV